MLRYHRKMRRMRGKNLIGHGASKEFVSNVTLVATGFELVNPSYHIVNDTQSILVHRREENVLTYDVVGPGSLVVITEPTHVYKLCGEESKNYLTKYEEPAVTVEMAAVASWATLYNIKQPQPDQPSSQRYHFCIMTVG